MPHSLLKRDDHTFKGRFIMDTFTLVHVAVSLVGIAAGFAVMYDLVRSKYHAGSTAVFLVATILTSVTGFGFKFEKLLPSHILGVLSLLVLAAAVYALYVRRLSGIWRPTYVIAALVAQYLDIFVLVVQAFKKIPVLHALAPTETELPFALTHLVVLAAFIATGVIATRRVTLAKLSLVA